MKDICEGYQHPIIYKIIWKHSSEEDDYDKYIFVGLRDKDIKKILKKR